MLPPAPRAQLLALAAAYLQCADLVELYSQRSPLRPRWAHAAADEHEELRGHTGVIFAVGFGHLAGGGDVLASVGDDATVRLWDPITGNGLRTLTGHTEEVRAVAFGRLADGRVLLASAGDDATVRLWDPTSGAELATLTGHEGQINAVAFGRLCDGRDLLASAGNDGTVRLWDPTSGTKLATLTGQTHCVTAVAFGRLKPHVGFGGRPGETGRQRCRHHAPSRPHTFHVGSVRVTERDFP